MAIYGAGNVYTCKEVGMRHKYDGCVVAFWKKKEKNYKHSWNSKPKPYAYYTGALSYWAALNDISRIER